ncbi:Late blight resistance protein R1-A [Sesamum alatum]|uniref:Late blight resistance protein R1-A n=1 Tax=Sesamum alatum TaxID=300844 RepID=A0AAE1YJ77_9LAMI|nr:Late blight resistance protein R1-A [Sesamum alatum]
MAATAYAAVVSVRRVLEDILHHAPAPQRILLHTQHDFQSLLEKITTFQHFLEDYDALQITSKPQVEDGLLEAQMAKACYAAEDIIESFVLDQIQAPSQVQADRILTRFSQDFHKVMQDVYVIEKKVMKNKGKMEILKDQQPVNALPADGLSARLAPNANIDTTTRLDSHLFQLKERLVGDEPKLKMVSIVGMGGIGKTTLARTIYDDSLIVESFEIRAWVTISQEYEMREILLALLHVTEILFGKRKQENSGNNFAKPVDMMSRDSDEQGERSQEDSANNFVKFVEVMSKYSDEQIGEQLRKKLYGRRYLIVMDDIWSIKVWDEVRKYFLDNSNRSRIVITTRLSQVAVNFDSDVPHEMGFLDDDSSWNLFCEKALLGEACPPELEEIGKQIAKSCKGLPLSLVVIGGLLAKSQRTLLQWNYVAENLVSVINLGNHEECLKILSLSYSHLPIHLKPCFLYMATFPEDCEIRISRLISLWIAEGFVNPIAPKSLEDIAMEYLKELIDRNLLIVRQQGTLGKMKSCIIHDLLRDLCLREAQKENFLCITKLYDFDIPDNIQSLRRLVISLVPRQYMPPQVFSTLRLASSTRSLACEFVWRTQWIAPCLKLLRVLNVDDEYSPEEIMQLINSRYLDFTGDWDLNSPLTSSVSLLWNLQSLTVRGICSTVLPREIWEMKQLRQLKFHKIVLPDPPHHSHDVGSQDSYILENLHTLSTLENFRFTAEFPKRIPNIKKMKIVYKNNKFDGLSLSYYCLEHLASLSRLESLTLLIYPADQYSLERFAFAHVGDFAFPHSLKKLTLRGCELPWDDMRIVGSLPKLEILRLYRRAFKGKVWNPSEGEFARLKFLQIKDNYLNYWVVEGSHFPILEHLVLDGVNLEELPLGLAEIHTLRLIELNRCYRSAEYSVKKIREERESMGYDDLQIRVSRNWEYEPDRY